jgi:hypothetical protein
MKYAVEMGSGATIRIKIGSDIQKLMEGGIHKHTDGMAVSIS